MTRNKNLVCRLVVVGCCLCSLSRTEAQSNAPAKEAPDAARAAGAAPAAGSPPAAAPAAPAASAAPATSAAPAATGQPVPPTAAGTQPSAPVSGGSNEPVWVGTVQAPAPATAQAPPPGACVPACGPGFSCVQGRCWSTCGPACGAKQSCVELGTCSQLPPPPPRPGARQHDGFLLRATSQLAFSTVSTATGDQRGTLRESGASAIAAVDVGMAVVDDLIVRARLAGSYQLARRSDFSELNEREFSLFVLGELGAGLDYYIMPLNLYVGATLGISGVSFTEFDRDSKDSRTVHSKAGLALDVDVGKEWWITGNWGMGLALRLRYMTHGAANIAPGSDGNLNVLQIGPLFTATYN